MTGFARGRTWLVAAALFALYATFLLWKIYATHGQLRVETLNELRLETEKRAEAAAYFLSERKNDVLDLANAPEAANFFANRDLGMSMEYGLALSAQAVEDKFTRLKKQKLLGGNPIYRDLALIDSDGQVVAGGANLADSAKALLNPTSHASTLQFRPGSQDIVISAPVWLRDHYRGQLVAWSDLPSFLAQLVGTRPEGNLALVDDTTGEPLGIAPGSLFLTPALRQQVANLASGNSRFLLQDAGMAGLVKVSIRGTSMALARLASTGDLEQGATPVALLVAAGTVPGLVLLVAILLERQRRRHQALTEEKGRLEGRNTELEKEVARRLAAEKELRQRTEELQHAYARAEAANHAKSQFLANMAHEIRTPMNGVLGMTELILEGELSEEQRDYAHIVLSSGQSLLTVLNDILDYSKIEAGMMQVEAVSFNPRKAVEQVAALFQKLAEGKNLDYHLSFSHDFPGEVVSDPTRVRQILSNLVSNAIKFTSGGRVTVRAESRTADGQTFLVFSVSDTGIGMDETTRANLFQPFSQADGSITRKFGGTGLGLVIARNLCRLLGGSIAVDSAPGAGSTFRFEIPAEIAAAPCLTGQNKS